MDHSSKGDFSRLLLFAIYERLKSLKRWNFLQNNKVINSLSLGSAQVWVVQKPKISKGPKEFNNFSDFDQKFFKIITYDVLRKFEIRPFWLFFCDFWPFSAIFDLEWPLIASRPTFLISLRQELLFGEYVVYFWSFLKIDPSFRFLPDIGG